jgi:LacI family transcriptional regulator
MTKRVLLKDIAKRAGVSSALVSYVLNGLEKEKRVSQEVVEKIHKITKELGYQPNPIARSLRSGKTNTIGLIIADISNPFSGQIARCIEGEAEKFGYTVIIGSSDENCTKFSGLIDSMLLRQVDGLIMAPAEGSSKQIERLIRENKPFVLIDRYFPDISTNHVVLDNFEATYNAVNYLISHGRKRICLIVYKTETVHMKRRIEGYKSAMKRCGLEAFIMVEEIPRQSYFQVKAHTERVMDRLLAEKDRLDALLFAANALSINGLYALRKHKVRVPEELAVIGFDGHEVFDFFEPPVAYIKQPLEEMGREAVRILIDQINGTAKRVHTEVRHEFINRESSG